MAKIVTLTEDVTLNDTEYMKGTVLSVSESIYESLIKHGVAVDGEVKPSDEKTKPKG